VSASAHQSAYELDRVGQIRGGRALLSDLSVSLPAGGVTALIGPSGGGKTTLLRLLNRLDDPASGSVRFFGQPITSLPVRALRLRAGFVFQAPVMFAGTVADNLFAALQFAGDAKVPDRAARVNEVLRLVELGPDFSARDAAALSGGEKQRVALARALVHRPEVLLLDEPTAALDPEVADRLIDTLRRLREATGLTIVMVTHRLREARSASTYAVMLEAGRLLEAGPSLQVLNEPQHERTRAFMLAGDQAGNHVS
jgi:putative ABC transport system ATP-binding protein